MEADGNSGGLPDILEYSPAPEVVRVHEQFSVLLQGLESKLATTNPSMLRAHAVAAEYTVPLLKHMAGLVALVQADLALRDERIFGFLVAQEAEEVVYGLPNEIADTLIGTLASALKCIKDDHNLEGPSGDTEACARGIEEVMQALEELRLTDEEEDDGDEGYSPLLADEG